MSATTVALIAGMIVGAPVGAMLLCILIAARDADERAQRIMDDEAADDPLARRCAWCGVYPTTRDRERAEAGERVTHICCGSCAETLERQIDELTAPPTRHEDGP